MKIDDISLIELTKRLVSLPSYVDGAQDEVPTLDFLADYLAAKLPQMVIEKQYIADSRRYNLLVKGKKNPTLFALGHIDTVQPKEGWRTDPLAPTIKQGKLYGLGAADMKASLAAFICAAIEEKQNVSIDSLALLIYVDEEYDFKGIKRFVADTWARSITPQLTLSLDGELAVATGCRGLIEMSLTIKGKSGHASNPANGTNAISESIAGLAEVGQSLAAFNDTNLGPTTINVAGIRGGTVQKAATGEVRWTEEGNVIPDTAEVVLEVRTSTPEVNADLVVTLVREALTRRKLTLAGCKVRHDIAPWPVSYDPQSLRLLRKVYANANESFVRSDRKLQGYIDAQIVAEQIKAPTFIIGTGGENKHGANENADLKSIETAFRIYRALLREVLA